MVYTYLMVMKHALQAIVLVWLMGATALAFVWAGMVLRAHYAGY